MFTIIAPLPNNLTTIVEPHRQKYDPLAQLMPLHIPLIDPFQFNDSLDTLYAHLNEVGELHSPIKIFLVGWDTYEGKEYQLHLPMTTGHKELTTLHYDLQGGPLNFLAGKIQDYWPRVIFGRFLQQADLEIAKNELKDFAPNLVTRIKQITLLHRDEMGQPWQVSKQFGLKATMTGRARRRASS